MATFELSGPDGQTFEVDAPDEAAALDAFHQHTGGAQDAPSPGVDKYHQDAQEKTQGWSDFRNGLTSNMNKLANGLTYGGWSHVAPVVNTIPEMVRHGTTDVSEGYKYASALQDELNTRGDNIVGNTIEFVGSIPPSLVGGGIIGNMMKGAGAAAPFVGEVLSNSPKIQAGFDAAGKFLSSPLAQNTVSSGVLAATDSKLHGGSATEGGVIGAGLGAATHGFGRLIGKGFEALSSEAAPNTLEGLEAAKTAAYDAFTKSGAKFHPTTGQTLWDNVIKGLEKTDFEPEFHGNTKAFLNLLDKKLAEGVKNGGIEPSTLQNLRITANDLVQRGEGRFAKPIRDALDDFILKTPESNIIAGPNTGAGIGNEYFTGNRLNTQLKKAELLQKNIDRAVSSTSNTGSGGNINNKLRQAATKTLDKRGGWTPEEVTALKNVSDPGVVQNTLRNIGKLGFGGNGLMKMLNIGNIADHPIPGTIIAGAGHAAKSFADRASQANIDRAMQTILNNGKPVPVELSTVNKVINRNPGKLGGVVGGITGNLVSPAPVPVDPNFSGGVEFAPPNRGRR